MLLEDKARRKKSSKHDNRFYTQLDMAIIKHDASVRKSKIKRGELKGYGNEMIYVCGCGREGCFLHTGYESIPQEQWNELVKKRSIKHH